jgi:hypothetical protein
MDDIERDRIDRYLFPRPPQDILVGATRAGLRDPDAQMWCRSEGLHVEKPLRFRCGHYAVTERDPGPVALLDLTGADGNVYRVGCAPGVTGYSEVSGASGPGGTSPGNSEAAALVRGQAPGARVRWVRIGPVGLTGPRHRRTVPG